MKKMPDFSMDTWCAQKRQSRPGDGVVSVSEINFTIWGTLQVVPPVLVSWKPLCSQTHKGQRAADQSMNRQDTQKRHGSSSMPVTLDELSLIASSCRWNSKQLHRSITLLPKTLKSFRERACAPSRPSGLDRMQDNGLSVSSCAPFVCC